jgi:hypothetical protein
MRWSTLLRRLQIYLLVFGKVKCGGFHKSIPTSHNINISPRHRGRARAAPLAAYVSCDGGRGYGSGSVAMSSPQYPPSAEDTQ